MRVLVIGASGAMGTAVVRRFKAAGWEPKAFSRDPEHPRAKALGIPVAVGDLNDRASIASAMEGMDAVFCNTDFWSSLSVETEFQQGRAVLQCAEAAKVRHVVYSSLDDCSAISRSTIPVPHYDAKAAVENWINRHRSQEYMLRQSDGWYSRRVTVLVTGPYYENFTQYFLPQRGTLPDGREGFRFAMPLADARFPMVALDDIAEFAHIALADPERWGGKTLHIGSEAPTMAQVAATFERISGIPAAYVPVPLAEFRQFPIPQVHDVANFFEFFQRYDLSRDYVALRAIHPGLKPFEQWLRETQWKGESVQVQKGDATGGN